MQQVTENYLEHQLQKLKSEYGAYAQKQAEMDIERREHNLVISTLEKLPGDRRCFRMVGGVLVERTVNEILPAVKRNLSGIEQVMANIEATLKQKKTELDEFVDKYQSLMSQKESE